MNDESTPSQRSMTRGALLFRDVLEMIGDTPLLELRRLDTGPCQLFAKLELANPGGSIKDRIALRMIEQAERDGLLAAGRATLVEATAGNTGLGLALVAALRGYRLVVVVPDKMSQEKIDHLRAFGAEVVITRSDVGKGHPEYYQDLAQRLAAETGAFYVNQFANEANVAAHYETTGPEIWEQMDGRVDAVVFGVGTGGTLVGTGRFLRERNPAVDIVLADPAGSVLAPLVRSGERVTPGSWLVEGVGEDFVPPILDLSLVTRAYTIDDAEAFGAARSLLRLEGVFGGSSTGLLLAAALRYCREQPAPRRVVVVVPDTGNKYLSKMYSDLWMAEQGLLERERFGDLRDLIVRRHTEGEDVTVSPADPLKLAYRSMRLHAISQLPVCRGVDLVGVIDEHDLLRAVSGRPAAFEEPVERHMVTSLETLPPSATVDELDAVLLAGKVALIREGGRYYGMITKIDLLHHLREQTR
jgi:cystathionine beta-synthase